MDGRVVPDLEDVNAMVVPVLSHCVLALSNAVLRERLEVIAEAVAPLLERKDEVRR